MAKQIKRLYRDVENGRVSGVCAGLSDYFEIDVALVRVLFLVFILCAGAGIITYIVMALIVDRKDVVLERMEKERKETVVDQDDDDPFAKYDRK